MTQFSKLYDKIQNNQANVSFNELIKLMSGFGFDVKNRSSHYTFRHDNLIEIITVKKEPGHIKAVYIKKCLKAIKAVESEV